MRSYFLDRFADLRNVIPTIAANNGMNYGFVCDSRSAEEYAIRQLSARMNTMRAIDNESKIKFPIKRYFSVRSSDLIQQRLGPKRKGIIDRNEI